MKGNIPTNIFRATLKKSSDYVKVHQGEKKPIPDVVATFNSKKVAPAAIN